VQVSFKVDARLTQGLHMGERWVSLPALQGAWDGKLFTVEAKVKRGAGGSAAVAWSASAPDMVDVSPDRGERVTITVLRAGESEVTVRQGTASRTFVVKVDDRPQNPLVSISQAR
jgi:hypothetical protein